MAWIGNMFRRRDLFVLMTGVIVVQLLAWLLADKYMFHPIKGGYQADCPNYVDVGTNGTRIACITVGPKHGKAAVIYCHGNAEDATSVYSRFSVLASQGYTIVSVDYPGYGLSDGTPSESGCYHNAHRLYDWLRERQGFAENEIYVVGYSIGSGVATELAATEKVAGLWLEAPFLSAPRVLTRIRLLAVDSFPNCLRIRHVRCPLVVLHGEDDDIIPVSHGKALFKMANDPKQFVAIPSAGHTDYLDELGADRYNQLMLEFLSDRSYRRRDYDK